LRKLAPESIFGYPAWLRTEMREDQDPLSVSALSGIESAQHQASSRAEKKNELTPELTPARHGLLGSS
jgi:hypothetical protein